MAEPGDPNEPKQPGGSVPHDFDDDVVGFTSAASMAGRDASPPSAPEPEAVVPAEPVAPEPQVAPKPAPEPEPQPAYAAAPMPTREPEPAREPDREFARQPAPAPENPDRLMSAYAVYVLILCSVPTFGAAAVVGLLVMHSRGPAPSPLLQSHYIFQARTLWTAAFAALAGLILLVVNLGVFVLFVLAVWALVRGAYGVLRLKAGQPIKNPRSWFI